MRTVLIVSGASVQIDTLMPQVMKSGEKLLSITGPSSHFCLALTIVSSC